MDRNILLGALFVVILVVIAVFIQSQGNGGISPREQGTTTYYVINYKNDTNVSGVGVAEKQSDGSYRLQDGTIVPATDVTRIEEKYEGTKGIYCCPSSCPLTYDPVCGVDGNTYVNVCGAALVNVRVAYRGVCDETPCDQPCIEPKPELRFVCQNGQIVRNRVDCQGNETCPYVVSRYFICPDGTKVKDPSECGAPTSVAALPTGIQTVFVCSDGREVASEADCSANCAPSTTTVTHVSPNYGFGGVVDTVYQCWDGSFVKSPKDCPLYCEDPCGCGDEIDPVCGVDGRTYRNPCMARCAGIKYTDGRCLEPGCSRTGERCTPASSVGTAVTHVESATEPTCCEEGSYCSENGVCVPITQCKQKGERCARPDITYTTAYVPDMQGDCCNGLFCDENNICSDQQSCGTSGSQCGWSGGVAAAPQYYGACCEDYVCTDNTCVKGCVQEFGDCKADGDCCEGLECSSFGQCRKPCAPEGSDCKASVECCGNLGCVDNVCAKKPIDVIDVKVLCSGAMEPEWGVPNSCATGYYEGEWDTYCGYCTGKVEWRYYCVKKTGMEVTGAPTTILTDQVNLSYRNCRYGCFQDSCE